MLRDLIPQYEGNSSDLAGLFKCCLQPCQMFICFLYKSSFLDQVDVAQPYNSKGNPSDVSGFLDVVCSLAKHFYMWHQSSFLEQFDVAQPYTTV